MLNDMSLRITQAAQQCNGDMGTARGETVVFVDTPQETVTTTITTTTISTTSTTMTTTVTTITVTTTERPCACFELCCEDTPVTHGYLPVTDASGKNSCPWWWQGKVTGQWWVDGRSAMDFYNRGREYYPRPAARLLTVNGSATAPALPKEPPAASDGVVHSGISQYQLADPGTS